MAGRRCRCVVISFCFESFEVIGVDVFGFDWAGLDFVLLVFGGYEIGGEDRGGVPQVLPTALAYRPCQVLIKGGFPFWEFSVATDAEKRTSGGTHWGMT